MQSTVVILGTGGTIAGRAADPSDHVGYVAGSVGVADLVAAVPALAGGAIEVEQVAQLDSKDMGFAEWQRLAQRAAAHLARPEVAGLVVTHGTDTLEETAYFLHRVLPATKPVVLTAAMRPASALSADGPRNLLDAVTVARDASLHGVVAVLAGAVHGAPDLRKMHPYRVDAFDSGDAGPLARIEEGRLRRLRDLAPLPHIDSAVIDAPPATWPAVEIVTSHAQARAAVVDALLAAGARGLVVAGTGNGTVHVALLPALQRAVAQGVPVWRCTRCGQGAVVEPAAGPAPGTLPSAGALSPVKARIELMLQLLAGGPVRPPST